MNLFDRSSWRLAYHRFIEAQQVRMSSNLTGLPILALLGLLSGLLAGGIIILFRLFMSAMASLYMPLGQIDGFELLSPSQRFLLCLFGGLLLGLLLQSLNPKSRNLGVVHVLERLEYHQGRLPIWNACVQFVAACIALLSGHSVGREGPSIHMGATASSALGRALRIPNNSVRILVGCGVAAAIAAAFNTPLAGVIFAMEVVILEYSVIGFAPVILAAVSATTLARYVFGDATAFSIPELTLNTVAELPIIFLMGLLIGCLSAAFIQLTLFTSRIFNATAIWLRTTLAGLITGLIAIFIPQIMGSGYDTLNHLLIAPIGLAGVTMLLIAKTFATSTAIGLGVPAGLIGPTLFIGATAGAMLGFVAQIFFPGAETASFYAMLGMAAMMAATLQAPLAALIFLLELTALQAIILPGMAAVIVAYLVTRIVFKKSSIYHHLMSARGLDYRNTPLSSALRRIGVASVMDRNIVRQARHINISEAKALLEAEPRWVLILDENRISQNSLLPISDLALYINTLESRDEIHQAQDIDLLSIPAKRLDIRAISIVATLQEAYERMEVDECEVLYITGAHGATKKRIYGVITKEHIDRSYQF